MELHFELHLKNVRCVQGECIQLSASPKNHCHLNRFRPQGGVNQSGSQGAIRFLNSCISYRSSFEIQIVHCSLPCPFWLSIAFNDCFHTTGRPGASLSHPHLSGCLPPAAGVPHGQGVVYRWHNGFGRERDLKEVRLLLFQKTVFVDLPTPSPQFPERLEGACALGARSHVTLCSRPSPSPTRWCATPPGSRAVPRRSTTPSSGRCPCPSAGCCATVPWGP